MHALAAASDRVSIKEYARTYEKRPLLLLTVTSEENHKKIDSIREQHKKLTDPNQNNSLEISKMPAVVWEGFSVHGNEPSGANASLLVAYHLAAAEGAEVEETLTNLVIMIDPMINRDGLSRFSQWVNSHRSVELDSNSDSREHNEAWSRGRTNHYWFDLNRDWLLLHHPESP
jgi:Zinc carboxypeptidase.